MSLGTQLLRSRILNFGPCAARGHPELSPLGTDDPTPSGVLIIDVLLDAFRLMLCSGDPVRPPTIPARYETVTIGDRVTMTCTQGEKYALARGV